MCGSGAAGFDPSHTEIVQGRLELSKGDTWWRVCADGFTGIEAEIACRQLGHSTGHLVTENVPREYFQEGCQLKTLTVSDCKGTESSLDHCTLAEKATCESPLGDVGLKCYWNSAWSGEDRGIRLMTA